MKPDARPSNPAKGPASEEPEFNAERDIPTEDDAEEDDVLQKSGDPPDDESVAGEEDPGAALDEDWPPADRKVGG